jgi:hypothetical protein
MRGKILFIVFLVIFAGSVSAFPADLKVVDRTASVENPAVFNITVENDYTVQDRFRISSLQSPPVSSNWFDYEYSKTIESGEKDTFRVEVTPEENSIQQNYAFTVNLRSLRNDEAVKLDSFVTVVNKYDLKITSFEISDSQVKPAETVEISATVQNTESESLDNFTVKAEGFNSTVEKTGAVLGAGDSIRYNFELDVPERSSPGDETIELSIYNNGEKSQSSSQTVNVEEVEEVEQTSQEEDRLLSKTETVTLENKGNVEVERTIERALPVYLDPLANFQPLPDETETEAAQQNYNWNMNLQPGESKKITYTVDYTPALGFVALLFLGVLGFKKLQTDLKVSKTTKNVDGKTKIRIELQNNSSKALTDLKVKDFVPDIAEVSKQFEMAKPVVAKTSSGTRLEWEIDNLQPGEQRVFEYRIKPLVEVEGGVNLDSAEIIRDGKKIKETSEINVKFQPE